MKKKIFPIDNINFVQLAATAKKYNHSDFDLIKQAFDQNVLIKSDDSNLLERFIDSFKDKGTYVKVIDFNNLPNGLLGITVKAINRVEIKSIETDADNLNFGDVMPISDPIVDDQSLLAKFPDLINILNQLVSHPKVKELPIDIDFSSADSVSYHLGGLSPLATPDKQLLLDAFDAGQRLNILSRLVAEMTGNVDKS